MAAVYTLKMKKKTPQVLLRTFISLWLPFLIAEGNIQAERKGNKSPER